VHHLERILRGEIKTGRKLGNLYQLSLRLSTGDKNADGMRRNLVEPHRRPSERCAPTRKRLLTARHVHDLRG